MHRRNFVAVLLAAPIAAVTAAKAKPQGFQLHGTRTGRFSGRSGVSLTREQEKQFRHAINYGMGPGRVRELFNAKAI